MISALRQKQRRRGHRFPLVGLACTLATAALAVSSCSTGGGTGPAQVRDAPLEPHGLEAAYSYIAATGAQLTEGNAFQQHLIRLRQIGAARCMTTLRRRPADEPLIRYDERYLDQPGPVAAPFQGLDTAGVPGLYDMALLARKGSMMVPISTGLPPYPNNLPGAAQNAIEADYLSCQRTASASFSQLTSDGNTLNQLWLHEVSAIQASGPVRQETADFARCARRNGAPLSASSSPTGYRSWLYSKTYTSANPYGKPTLIRPLVATDRHWTAVFASCAGSLEALMQRLQLQAQKAFLQSHYHQVQALQLAAANIGRRGVTRSRQPPSAIARPG